MMLTIALLHCLSLPLIYDHPKRFDAFLRYRQCTLTLMTQGVLILTVQTDDDARCTHIDGTN